MSSQDQHPAEIIGHKSALDGMRKFIDDEKTTIHEQMDKCLDDDIQIKDMGVFNILTGQLQSMMALENWITLNYDKEVANEK
jgi:hypothetical protein